MIHQKIKQYRQSAGLSVRELADMAGVGKSAIVRLESADYNWNKNTMEKVLKVLNLEIDIKSIDK